jgi:hypothetical protein
MWSYIVSWKNAVNGEICRDFYGRKRMSPVVDSHGQWQLQVRNCEVDGKFAKQ